jgi:hypothetical protein
MSQNRYSVLVLSKKPTTNYLSYILVKIKHTAYYTLAITSLVYSEILNVLYIITIYIKKHIYLETKL